MTRDELVKLFVTDLQTDSGCFVRQTSPVSTPAFLMINFTDAGVVLGCGIAQGYEPGIYGLLYIPDNAVVKICPSGDAFSVTWNGHTSTYEIV